MQRSAQTTLDEQAAHAIGMEAYTYLYPLVLMETTRAQMTNVEQAGQGVGRGPANTFVHVREFPPAEFRDVVRPNFDTLYSIAWLDLREEPLVVSAPDADDGYYLLPMYDMWGEVFDAPGTRTTGNGAGAFAVVPPGWSGTLPEGVKRIDAPHSMVWIIGRTKASPQTYAQVHRFQDGLGILRLSAWGSDAPPVKGVHDPSIDDSTPPLRTVDEMSPGDFLATAAELLKRYPPHFNDLPVLHRLERAGLRVGESFDLDAAEPTVRSAFATAIPEARAHVAEFQKRIGRTVNGWLMNTAGMGTYGTDYLKRACVELIGLGANCAEDAIYPLSYADAHGEPYTGERDYVLHFGKDELPPALAFWSMTSTTTRAPGR